MAAFRSAALAALGQHRALNLQALQAEHRLLTRRLHDAPDGADAVALWLQMGIECAAQVSDMDADEVRSLRRAGRSV